MIRWNGKSSDDFGVFIENVPAQNHPARKFTVVSVPGRNGDLVLPQNAWENYKQEYDIFAGENDGTAQPAFLEIAEWLYSASGYALLEDSFYPAYFRMARFDGPFDVEFKLTRVGKTTITFDCMPQRYLVSGLIAEEFTASGVIENPTLFPAKPNIRIYGTGILGIGAASITISAHSFDYIDIDCEAMDCFFGANNANSYVSTTGTEFPTLGPGATNVLLGTGITKVEITPRWYTI